MPIRLAHLGYTFPDATRPLLHDATTTLSARVIGIVGANGAGKTTLVRLLTGSLQPTSGTITSTGSIGLLPQDVVRRDDRNLADLLGVGAVVGALARIDAGSTDQRDYDLVGDQWDLRERAQALVARHVSSLGTSPDLSRTSATLSGGEVMQVAACGLLLQGHAIVVMDEPTNNLDAASRQRFLQMVDQWQGCLVLVSHDPELLGHVDQIVEVRDGSLRTFTGNHTTYLAAIDREQKAVQRDIRDAARDLQRERAERIAEKDRQDRSHGRARRDLVNAKYTRMGAGQAQRAAQEHAGRTGRDHAAREAQAREALDRAQRGLRNDDAVTIDLPDPHVSVSRDLAELHHAGGCIIVRGQERIVVTGDNGVGKTTLLRSLMAEPTSMPAHGIARTERIGHLDQKLDRLDDHATVLETVRASAPSLTTAQARSRLARFLIRGDDIHRRVGTLSGGERFRVALASLLLAEPTHQLLLLDEPTNNLDTATTMQLLKALDEYRGGIIVVSHDPRLLAGIHADRSLVLTQEGFLSDV